MGRSPRTAESGRLLPPEGDGMGLDPTDFFSAVLAYSGSFFNDLGTKRALAGKIAFVDFCNGRIDLFLDQLIAEFGIAQRFNGFHFADVPEHLGCFLPHPVRVGWIYQDGQN